jgi:hypothetical protein
LSVRSASANRRVSMPSDSNVADCDKASGSKLEFVVEFVEFVVVTVSSSSVTLLEEISVEERFFADIVEPLQRVF